MVEDPGRDHAVVAGQDPRHVLDGLPLADADLLAPDGDRVAAEADDRHLGGVAGPVRRLLEDEGHAPAGERPGSGSGVVRPGPAPAVKLGRGVEFVDLQEVPHQAARRGRWRSRMATASSISSSLTSSDGASRKRRGRDRVDDQTGVEGGGRDRAGLFPLVQLGGDQQPQAPHRRDARQRLQGGHQVAARRLGPGPGTSSASMTASTARAAAVASGWPPNVVA